MSGASRSLSLDSADSNRVAAPDGEPGPDREEPTMTIGNDPAVPQTPERQTAQARSPADPGSSRVTINLRNEQNPRRSASPSSLLSSRESEVPSQTVNGDDEVKASVEGSEMDMSSQPGLSSGTPASSSAEDAGSPPLEVVNDPPDDDSPYEDVEPQVTILRGMQANNLMDPTGDFPYRHQGETYADTVTKLSQFITTRECSPHMLQDILPLYCLTLSLADPEVVVHIREWLDSYLMYARSVDYMTVFESYQDNRNLWHSLPELIWVLSNSRYRHFLQFFAQLCIDPT